LWHYTGFRIWDSHLQRKTLLERSEIPPAPFPKIGEVNSCDRIMLLHYRHDIQFQIASAMPDRVCGQSRQLSSRAAAPANSREVAAFPVDADKAGLL
jgi:hypothetical protein